MSYKTLVSKFKDALGVKKLDHIMNNVEEPGEVWRPWAETIQSITRASNPEELKMSLAKLDVYNEALYNFVEREHPSTAIKGRRVDSGMEVLTNGI